MPVAAKPWLWGLLVMLLLGLVVMHHAPEGHASGHGADRALAAAEPTTGPAASAAHDDCDCADDTTPATAHSPVDLLHLCLAIAVAAAALAVPLLTGVSSAPASPPVSRAGPGDRPRPPEIPRRLAALGVLRL